MMLGESFGSQVRGGLLIMVNQSDIHIWVFPKNRGTPNWDGL